jgi:DNA polymerase-3 subunit gamma/tau
MSTFVVSARKYRPHRFEDVVGQEHVTNTLKNALRNDHLAHAFLFCGPRGVGKTTCARILAKVLNCQNVGADFEPCNTCSSCQAFNENASFNITELDAASNNSVEHIRALIEQVRFQPQQGKYKIYIIDEVHMLSQQAFNAFLKTLEEPPPYAIFILATTEKHKIIPTILSRCQIFDFKRIQVQSMVDHLKQICTEESIQVDPEALHIISLKADGALRDALSIFDRIVAFSGNEINYQDVIDNLNVLDYDYYFRFVDALLLEDISTVMLIFDEILKKGFDPDVFLSGLAEHLRNLLMAKDQTTIALLTLSEGLQQRYLLQSAKTPATFLLTALNLANDCDIHYKTARNKRLHVEMGLIKMTYIHRAVAISEGTVQPPVEKKTAELSNKQLETAESNIPPIPAAESPSVEPVEEQNPAVALSEEEEKELPEDNPQAASDQVAEPAATQHLKPPETINTSLLTVPTLGNVKNMLKQLREEAATEIVAVAKYELNLENLVQIWKEYVVNVELDSLRNMLGNVELELDGNMITAVVSSKLVENAVRQEVDIIQKIRSDFAIQDLSLGLRIDKSKVITKPKKGKPLTNKDRLRSMYEQNPEVKTLTDRFGLRFDD